MIGLNTNVLLRCVMRDAAQQSPLATQLVKFLQAPAQGFVALVSLLELGWVLSFAHRLERAQLSQVFEGLLRSKEIVLEQAGAVWKALCAFQNTNADFADGLIERLAAAAGYQRTFTFDRGAVRGCGMALLA